MAVQHEFDVAAQRVADGAQRAQSFFHVALADVQRAAGLVRGEVQRPHFEAADALVQQFLGVVHRFVDHRPVVVERAFVAHDAVAGPAVVARRPVAPTAVGRAAAAVVDGDARTRASAQQLPDGLLRGLAEDVPQRQVDGGDGAQLRAAGAEVGGPFVEEAEVPLDLQRVRAQQTARHPVVDHGRDRVGHVVRFTAAHVAGIGVDAQRQQPRHHVLGHGGFDLRDLDVRHESLPRVSHR